MFSPEITFNVHYRFVQPKPFAYSLFLQAE